MHASQIQGCVVEQRVEKKRYVGITEAGQILELSN